MPASQELPEAIGSFSFRNGLPLDSGRDFHNHVDRIVSGISAALQRSAKVRADNLRSLPDETSADRRHGPASFLTNKTWPSLLIAFACLVIAAFLFLQKNSLREQVTSSSQSLTLAVTPAPTQAMLDVASPVPAATASVAAPSPLASPSAETAQSPVPMAAATVPQSTIDNPVSADASPASEEAIIVVTLSADRYGHSVRTAFDFSTPTIYAMLKTIGLKRGDELRAAWIAEFARSGIPKGTVLEEKKMTIFHDIDGDDYFAWRPVKGWIPGKYRLEIYLNGKQMAHSEFTILKP